MPQFFKQKPALSLNDLKEFELFFLLHADSMQKKRQGNIEEGNREKKTAKQVVVVLPTIGNEARGPLGGAVTSNFPVLPTFKMIINNAPTTTTKLQRQVDQKTVADVTSPVLRGAMTSSEVELVTLPRLTINRNCCFARPYQREVKNHRSGTDGGLGNHDDHNKLTIAATVGPATRWHASSGNLYPNKASSKHVAHQAVVKQQNFGRNLLFLK